MWHFLREYDKQIEFRSLFNLKLNQNIDQRMDTQTKLHMALINVLIWFEGIKFLFMTQIEHASSEGF